MSEQGDVTRLLQELGQGGRALDELLPLVYDELRQLARHRLGGEVTGHTLQPTALVHEAYLKLSRLQRIEWKNRRPRNAFAVVAAIAAAAAACDAGAHPAGPTSSAAADLTGVPTARAGSDRVELGRRLFFEETFGGNGRTCGTCHPTPTLVLTPADIAALPPDDPFFAGVMDFDPGKALEGMIRYPLGGASLFEPDMVVFRSIPTIRNVRRTAPFTSDGRASNLREQALEATLLHLLDGAVDRPGERLPSPAELDAIVAFEEAMQEPESGRMGMGPLDAQARAGRALFFGEARCVSCHVPPEFTDNGFHNVVASTDAPSDPGRCRIEPAVADCWSGAAFNTPQLRGVAHSAPFFHDNSLPTLRAVVEFYNSRRFSESPAAQRLRIDPLDLDHEEVAALVAFLESL
jgi:cytochrome c peroxidase